MTENAKFSANDLILKTSTILKQRFSVLLASLFILWTPILIGTTVKAQNSCEPVVQWSQTLPGDCTSSSKESTTSSKPEEKSQSIDKSKDENEGGEHRRDIAGAVAGTVAIGTATIVGAPAAAAAGIGVAVWFIVRTIVGK